MSRKNVLLIVALVFGIVLSAFAAGCTAAPSGNTGTAGTAEITVTVVTEEPVEITVFAAASLKGALTDIVNKFMEEN
ncbi:MAG: hypothetical protein J6X83_02990, partial [Methanomicrobium sp.]|nr:hypothetical protein [Methanomicrobium sp.]